MTEISLRFSMRYALGFLIGLLCHAGIAQSSLILDRVVARVGSEYILYSDIQELYSYAREQNPDYDERFQCDVLEQLIAKKMLLDQAKLDSIEISEVEVQIELDRRIDYILSQMGGDEEIFYNYYGKTPREQQEIMREPLREDMIQQRIQNQLIKDITITPKEVIEFYNSIPPDSIPFQNAEVEVAEITMSTIINEEAKKAAREQLEDLRSRIIDGNESFEELASIFSDDPGSARNGGDLGWAKRGTYVPEFEATAYALEPGEISEIVETQFGFHLLQLIQRRGNTINVRHILIKPEVTEDDYQETRDFLDSIKNMIEVDSMSFDLAVKLYSDEDAQSYNNAGRLLNPSTGDTFWETSQLPYQIYFSIEQVEVGGMTDIVELEERGEKIFKVLLLQSKTRPHRLSLETDFSKIQQFAKENKKGVYFNNWMKDKIRNTFIEVTSHFAGCPNLDKYGINIRP